MVHTIQDPKGHFSRTQMRFYVVNTDDGVVVRAFVPMIGWHFVKGGTGGSMVVDCPCSPLPLKEILRELG